AEVGANVLGVGDQPQASLAPHLKQYLADYLQVPRIMDEEDVIARVAAWLRGKRIDRILSNLEPGHPRRSAARALRDAGDERRRGQRLSRQAADEGAGQSCRAARAALVPRPLPERDPGRRRAHRLPADPQADLRSG